MTSFLSRIQPAPKTPALASPDHWTWCGSPLRDDAGRYHLYASRWSKQYPFFIGYIIDSHIVHAIADTPEGPYRVTGTILPPRGPEHWDGTMTHNPTIHRLGNTYYLYYIGATCSLPRPTPEQCGPHHPATTTYPAAATTTDPAAEAYRSACYNAIRIGLATASSPEGPWTRRDAPILLPRPDKWDAKVVTNPAPCILPDGRTYLIYRSNTPQGLRLGIAYADQPTGPFRRLVDDPILQLPAGQGVEDPYLWHNGRQFELIAKDMTGAITGEHHAGVHATSPDAVHWILSTPPKAWSRTVRWTDGTTSTQGSLERPQLLFQNGRPTHLFAATADGPGSFYAAENTWTMVLTVSAD